MKKTIILSALMAAFAISAFAQFKVGSNGHVSIGPGAPSNALLKVWDSSSSAMTRAISASISGQSNQTNAAIFGDMSSTNSYTLGSNYGVYGQTFANSYHGRNFGVSGMINFDPSNVYGGAGVYATSYNYYFSYPTNIQGIYAAYFQGSTNLQGQTMAQEIYIPADNDLSENVESVATRSGEGTPMLDNLLRMNVREFNLKSSQPVKAPENVEELTEEDRQGYEYLKKEEAKQYSRRHFGLSAQELKEIYPNLVLEAQDGYLYVNYTELVPVLIRAIQELKEELDAVKGSGTAARKAPAATSVSLASINGGNVLYQNTPNPFKEQTTIRFSLADDARDASICIFDMTGKMLKNLPISSGETSVSVNGWELGEGMFFYTLIVNGKEIDTKRMIITK